VASTIGLPSILTLEISVLGVSECVGDFTSTRNMIKLQYISGFKSSLTKLVLCEVKVNLKSTL